MAREVGAEADRNWFSMGGAETRLKEAVMKFNRLSESTNKQTKADKPTIGETKGGARRSSDPVEFIVVTLSERGHVRLTPAGLSKS